MEILFERIKDAVLNFKLNLCCFMFSVRVGILLFGFYNLISSVVALISVMTGSFPTLYMHAQQIIMDSEYVPSNASFAYCAEISASILLMCGMYRKDTTLLRYFTYVGLAMAAGTVLVYAMVIGVLDALSTIILAASLTYQIYLILLVRSYIVEIQAEEANAYKAKWLSDIKAIAYRPEDEYTIVLEPEAIKEPEDLSIREVIDIIEMNEDEANPIKDDIPINDTVTNYAITEPSTSKEPNPKNVPLRYPFKFVAIKVPAEKTIEEEKTVDDVKKESDGTEITKDETNEEPNKTVINEEVVKDATKPPKLPRRSIFGRKKKRKDSITKNDEPKKP